MNFPSANSLHQNRCRYMGLSHRSHCMGSLQRSPRITIWFEGGRFARGKKRSRTGRKRGGTENERDVCL